MIYFAKLDGDMVGIDAYCRFEADSEDDAIQIAEDYARENYEQYEDAYDENDDPLFYSSIEPWSDKKHGHYIGDACFTDYLNAAS